MAAMTKDELFNAVFWVRHALAVLLGVVWGAVPLTGLLAFASYLLATVSLVHLLVTVGWRVDVEAHGGYAEVAKEGMTSSIALFLLAWVAVYTAVHF